jgi:hypothetical protein
VLTGVVAQGLTIYDTLRKSVGESSAGASAGLADRTKTANGSAPAPQDAEKS